MWEFHQCVSFAKMVNNSNKNCYDDLLSDDIGPFGYKNYIRINPFLILTIGEGNGTPLQYSCLENPMDGGAW